MSIDDLNWGRLNLISAVDQVGDQTEWSVQSLHGGRQVRVSCQALPQHSVPHGVDNDVSSALIDLLMTSGLPENGTLIVSLSELMDLAGFHRSGKYRDLMRESLARLHTTVFEVSGGWRDHPNRRWITTSFHFVESLTYTHQGEAGRFDERTMIQLRIADQLVASMRSGYTKPLNMSFMQTLSRPRTRTLFRLLDASRYDPENPDRIADTLDVSVAEWADQCKISGRLADVRRALASPHEELIKRGYLRAATYSGRGKDQRLFYEFAPDFTQINPVLLTRFRRHGVTDGVARSLAQIYSPALLLARIDVFEALVKSGNLVPKKSSAAALVHLIKNPDSYQAPAPLPTAPTGGSSRPRKASVDPGVGKLSSSSVLMPTASRMTKPVPSTSSSNSSVLRVPAFVDSISSTRGASYPTTRFIEPPLPVTDTGFPSLTFHWPP